MKITEIAIDKIRDYEDNPRVFAPSDIDKLAAGIKEFGFLVPVIVDAKNVLVAGHKRIRAARQAGLKTVPTVSAEHLSDAAIRAFRLFENRSREGSKWDFGKLAGEISSLHDAGFDLSLTGFEQNELAPLMAEQTPMPVEDEKPADQPEDKPMKHSVKFSTDQWGVVLQAIQRVREMEKQSNIDDARCLELICADFIAA